MHFNGDHCHLLKKKKTDNVTRYVFYPPPQQHKKTYNLDSSCLQLYSLVKPGTNLMAALSRIKKYCSDVMLYLTLLTNDNPNIS